VYPTKNDILKAKSDDVKSLALFDSLGLLIAPGEDIDMYKKRLLNQRDKITDFQKMVKNGNDLNNLVEYPVGTGCPMSENNYQEAAILNKSLYDFTIDWVPAFFLSKGLGFLWGGCTILSKNGIPLFFIRKSFQQTKHWFIYDRDELTAHELCHAAHCVFPDSPWEEHFAYQTSKSRLRRYMGNCFRTEYDAVLFLLPVLLLICMEFLIFSGILHIVLWPFVITALLYPVYLLIRNQTARNVYFHAENHLNEIGCTNAPSVLFRCTSDEICRISKLQKNDLIQMIQSAKDSEIRWKVIFNRFFTEEAIQNGSVK